MSFFNLLSKEKSEKAGLNTPLLADVHEPKSLSPLTAGPVSSAYKFEKVPVDRPSVVSTPPIAVSKPNDDEPLRHPLEDDDNVMHSAALERLQKIDPKATLPDLLLGRSKHAVSAIAETVKGSKTAQHDAALMKSLLALHHLHSTGAITRLHDKGKLTKEELAIHDIAQAPYLNDDGATYAKAYGLTKEEHTAVQAYSDANKSVAKLGVGTKDERDNPNFMGEHKNWGAHKNGWNALGSAMTKIPTLGQLGLTMTTYRASRKSDETAEALSDLKPGTHVAMGVRPMTGGSNIGQLHYASTAVTYNSHWGRSTDVGGMVAVTGTSGRYINPFGLQGMVDGGEVLYPPKTLTTYEGPNPQGYQGPKNSAPVFHLRETQTPEPGQRIVEDFVPKRPEPKMPWDIVPPPKFAEIKPAHPQLDQMKQTTIENLEQLGAEKVNAARKKTGIDGPVAELRSDELWTLHQAAQH